MSQKYAKGASMGEYGLALGLVTTFAIGSMVLLRDSISDLLLGSNGKFSAAGVVAVTNAPSSAGGEAPARGGAQAPEPRGGQTGKANFKGSGYYGLTTDPATGAPIIQLMETSGGTTNVTSVDGHSHTLGSARLAMALSDLAAQQTDPALKSYYDKMAELAFYMGGVEGELDGVQGLQLTEDSLNYKEGSALRDLLMYQGQLQKLIDNPPAGADPQAVAQALPLAADVFNIAQNYLNTFEKHIQNGQVQSFIVKDNSKPGAALSKKSESSDSPLAAKTYDQIWASQGGLTSLKAECAEVLNEYRATGPVEATLKDAQALDTAGAAPAPAGDGT